MTDAAPSPAIIAIGRNEGERLKTCLRSLPTEAARIYVDSGSTDGSVAFAKTQGVAVVTLPPGTRFTAALARNAGLAALAGHPTPFVQVVDGDCELDPAWLDTAVAALVADPGLAVVFGRRRERFPDASIYNRMCDDEWNVPVGEANSCGGDALFRRTALDQAGGYAPELIAGEEPDLCLRLRRSGWRIRRLDAEMTRHDAAMTRFGQWWRRTERSGHAFAQLGLAARRGGRSALATGGAQHDRLGGVLPVLIVVAALAIGWWAGLALALLYPVQVVRIALRMRHRPGLGGRAARSLAFHLVLGKFAQIKGAALFHWRRLTGRHGSLIEYKGPEAQRA